MGKGILLSAMVVIASQMAFAASSTYECKRTDCKGLEGNDPMSSLICEAFVGPFTLKVDDKNATLTSGISNGYSVEFDTKLVQVHAGSDGVLRFGSEDKARNDYGDTRGRIPQNGGQSLIVERGSWVGISDAILTLDCTKK